MKAKVRKKILAVDDEYDASIGGYMKYYVQALEAEFDVTAVSTVDLALQALAISSDFDIAILDGELPCGQELNSIREWVGVRLARDLSNLRPNVRVILLSNHLFSGTNSELIPSNIIEIISKFNCTPFQLVNRVKEHMNRLP